MFPAKKKLSFILVYYLSGRHAVKKLTVVVSLEKGAVDLNGGKNSSTTLGAYLPFKNRRLFIRHCA
jgi:hypothetical protein